VCAASVVLLVGACALGESVGRQLRACGDRAARLLHGIGGAAVGARLRCSAPRAVKVRRRRGCSAGGMLGGSVSVSEQCAARAEARQLLMLSSGDAAHVRALVSRRSATHACAPLRWWLLLVGACALGESVSFLSSGDAPHLVAAAACCSTTWRYSRLQAPVGALRVLRGERPPAVAPLSPHCTARVCAAAAVPNGHPHVCHAGLARVGAV
jgi:hypothetical protein